MPYFSSILCPIDFSEHSRMALRYAAALATRSRGSLTVLFINDPLLVAAAAAAYNTHALGAATQEELLRFVDDSLPVSTRRDLRLDCRTEMGKPAREIRRALDSGHYDAVVVGTKGLNGAQRLFLGSTTSEILRHASVPVLAVPLADPARGAQDVDASWPGRHVLAPLALDEHAEGDLSRAAGVASWLGASLVVLHVIPVHATPAWFHGNVEGPLQDLGEKARAALDALTANLPAASATVIAEGYPPDEIAREATERRIGLVVMTLRGGGGVLGAPVGSIAYAVLSHGSAPVLALPAPEHRQR